MPVGIKELKPKKKMPLPKPKPRHANPKHPMNAEKTKPLGKKEGGKMPVPISPRQMAKKKLKENYDLTSMSIRDDEALKKKQARQKTLLGKVLGSGTGKDIQGRSRAKKNAVNMLKEQSPKLVKRITKKASGGSMKIKSGDTLSQIAKKNNISLRDLLSANPSIKNANQIRVGQSIKLPSTKMVGSSIGATRNPYKNMSKKDMADMDVKNKSAKRQQAVTKRSRVSAMDELKAKAKAPKPRTKQGGETVKSTMKKAGKTVMSAAKSGFLGPRAQGAAEIVNNAPKAAKAAKSLRLRRGKPPQTPSMSGLRDDDVAAYKGGAMKKKVRAYKHGGSVCRGGGAATKGKRFGRSG